MSTVTYIFVSSAQSCYNDDVELISSDFDGVNEADVKSLYCQPRNMGMLEINTSNSLKVVKEGIDKLGHGTHLSRKKVQDFFDDVVTMDRKDVRAEGLGYSYLRSALEPADRARSRDKKVECGACSKIICRRSQGK